ncbi:hypothetical protein EYC80_003846 [Monilinia laxa]|uniref:Uncharacterized protein n=1 Tax=Monilinia laxa TaxID=61186 RepID=A0A5N6KLF3_MONLA|nr:hypothetical protein EYC80_003846 [Monilinia laxa]
MIAGGPLEFRVEVIPNGNSVDDQADQTDQTDQAAETNSSQSYLKRNHQEVEKGSDLTTSIRMASIEKEQVSPAKRHCTGRGMGPIRLQDVDNDKSHGLAFMETEATALVKGKGMVPDTFNLEKTPGHLNPAPLGVALPSTCTSEIRSESLRFHEKMSIEEESFKKTISPIHDSPSTSRLSAASLSFAQLPQNLSEDSNPHSSENRNRNHPNTIKTPQTQFHKPESNYEDISSNKLNSICPNIQGPENNYEYLSNIFESLYPLVENCIKQQKSQLETVTGRINRIFGLLQQGERLQQNGLTAEMASQLKNTIDELTIVISQNFDDGIDGRSASNFISLDSEQEGTRDLTSQLRVLFEISDDAHFLIEFRRYITIRSKLGVPYSDAESDFIMTSIHLSNISTKLREELERLNMKGPEELPFILEMNLRERESVSRQIKRLKRAMATFYKYED